MSVEQQLELALRLLVALVLGAVVGLEREYHDHPAGLRTMALVAFGSCLFTVAGAYVFGGRVTDPTRVAAAIGMAVAYTLYILSALGTALVVGWLMGFRYIEQRFFDKEPIRRPRTGRRPDDPVDLR